MINMFSAEFKATWMIRMLGFWRVPMIHYCRPVVISISQTHSEIKIPLKRHTKNHLNSMYFGALAVGADITAGILAMARIRESKEKIILIFKDFHADFKLRAEGDVHFYCMDGEKIYRLVRRAIQSGERENEEIKIIAKVPSISNRVVADFSETLSLKLK